MNLLGDLAGDLGTTLPKLALAWCLKNPDVSTVLLGATQVHQLEENLGAPAVVPLLTEDVMARIEEILDNAPARPEYDLMRIDILSAVPDLLRGPFSESIVGRAREAGVVEVEFHDIRKWTTDKHGKIDDTPFGGGAGMVIAIQPIVDAIADLVSAGLRRGHLPHPDGERLTQPRVNQLSLSGNLILLCGHYKGIDQRIRDHIVTLELSIGDYVLSGGELAAAVLADALVRLVPGAIGDEAPDRQFPGWPARLSLHPTCRMAGPCRPGVCWEATMPKLKSGEWNRP